MIDVDDTHSLVESVPMDIVSDRDVKFTLEVMLSSSPCNRTNDPLSRLLKWSSSRGQSETSS